MPETVSTWWARRQWSKGVEVPYPVGTYRREWQQYPVLIQQYHPDLNSMITLTQIPPAAEVYLVWECDVGHYFVATPQEQRMRPGRERRRSVWCPECLEGARPRTAPRAAPRAGDRAGDRVGDRAGPRVGVRTAPRGRAALDGPTETVGEAFMSSRAPKPASAAEADLRQRIGERFAVDLTPNAVRVGQPFFDRLEVWPDIVIDEFRVAIEYDTLGRHGLEHVGRREPVDRHKDRLLRAAGWEVIRIRIGKLLPLGPHDIVAGGITAKLIDRLDDELSVIRGDLIVAAYRR
ncbi:MAG: hypothetical protein ACOH1T_06975 [Microbacteriaceae bacterium]